MEIQQEPRSWVRPVEVAPIPTERPSIKDLAKGFNDLHRCHDITQKDVKQIKAALKLDEDGKTVAGLSTPRQAFWRTFTAGCSALAAAGITIRISEALWPFVKGGAMALIHLAEQGRL